MHRFFCPPEKFNSGSIEITDKSEIRHLKTVLRLKMGSVVQVFDGQGNEATGRLTSIKENSFTLKVEHIERPVQRKTKIILACAIPKKAKLETIIEKCTELGADEIIPLKTERTEFSADEARRGRKQERYKTVAANAAKQSKRKTIPIIHPITHFPEALASVKEGTAAFIPVLFGKRQLLTHTLNHLGTIPEELIFFIGPEGDFTEQELDQALKAGCLPVSLGKTTLKVDTAAILCVGVANLFLPQHE